MKRLYLNSWKASLTIPPYPSNPPSSPLHPSLLPFLKRFVFGSSHLSWKLSKQLFSKHRPSGPRLSISRFVHMSVCLSVCSLLRYRLTVFLPPLPEVGCPIFLEIRNPWGKVMERSCHSRAKITAQKKVSFFC